MIFLFNLNNLIWIETITQIFFFIINFNNQSIDSFNFIFINFKSNKLTLEARNCLDGLPVNLQSIEACKTVA